MPSFFKKAFFIITPFLVIFAGFVFFYSKDIKKSILVNGCQTEDLSGNFDHSPTAAFFEGKEIFKPLYAWDVNQNVNVLGVTTPSNRWIEIDLSEQKLKAWDGETLYLETSIASGLPHTPTPTGEFNIWGKFRYVRMDGGVGRYYYNLPNVPFVMFFENSEVPGFKGYGLHGTYWHNSFGTPRSHGCVNLPTSVAEKLYYWTTPVLPDGIRSVRASEDNPGTKIVIHE